MPAKERGICSESTGQPLVIHFQNHLDWLKKKLTTANLLLDINDHITRSVKSLANLNGIK